MAWDLGWMDHCLGVLGLRDGLSVGLQMLMIPLCFYIARLTMLSQITNQYSVISAKCEAANFLCYLLTFSSMCNAQVLASRGPR